MMAPIVVVAMKSRTFDCHLERNCPTLPMLLATFPARLLLCVCVARLKQTIETNRLIVFLMKQLYLHTKFMCVCGKAQFELDMAAIAVTSKWKPIFVQI